jgi:hypothetical protein
MNLTTLRIGQDPVAQLQRFHLRQLIPQLDSRFRYVVEVRGRSWFQDLAYNFFADNNMCMGKNSCWVKSIYLRK